ncbi:endonuclease/exonuclease/phosphatase family protein [Pseudogemmobacter sp. W21_MBD1_M6]|uniref:endonuclease/exonuclease/phosphatase family protein n=1 Tax=Pseudogemmobacter sp. W21_MBD1_M6 TaxID=3240271 RepID=UPI003F9DF318
MTGILPELPQVTPDERARILASPRTAASHRDLLGALPGMNAVQTGGAASVACLPADLSVVAWNVERCLFPQESADLLAAYAPHIVLLSEVDHGMARTGQCHTTQDMARAMGMVYAFGVEFHELDLGGATERAFCKDYFNERGWHGNAILSVAPFDRVTMIRLDDHGHWFASDELDADPDQPRVGGRMALAAILATENGHVCVVSTHLESNADAPHRAAQFDTLMQAVDDFAPDMPVLIGGDMNTGNHMPPDYDWRSETLFARAEAQGYDWGFTPDGHTTRPSLITPHPSRKMKLDWFCARGLACRDKALIPALTDDLKPLSDHDAVWCIAGISKETLK